MTAASRCQRFLASFNEECASKNGRPLRLHLSSCGQRREEKVSCVCCLDTERKGEQTFGYLDKFLNVLYSCKRGHFTVGDKDSVGVIT